MSFVRSASIYCGKGTRQWWPWAWETHWDQNPAAPDSGVHGVYSLWGTGRNEIMPLALCGVQESISPMRAGIRGEPPGLRWGVGAALKGGGAELQRMSRRSLG